MKRLPSLLSIVVVGLLVSVLPLAAEPQRYRPPPYRPPPPVYRPPPMPKYEPPRLPKSYELPKSTEHPKSPFDHLLPPHLRSTELDRARLDPLYRPPAGLGLLEGLESPSKTITERLREAEVQRAAEAQIRETEILRARFEVEAAVKAASSLAASGSWDKAAALAEKALERRGYTDRGFGYLSPTVATGPLQKFVHLKRNAEALDRLQKLLDSKGKVDPGESVPDGVPLSVERAHREYQRLKALHSLLISPRELTDKSLPRTLAALKELQSDAESRSVANALMRELAVKALLSDQAAEANRLLEASQPSGDSSSSKDKAHAEALLRDVKAVILGEGSVETWAGAEVLRPKPDETNHPTRGPPLVATLLPEVFLAGYRPPVREKATEDLPSPAQQVSVVVDRRRANLEDAVRTEQQRLEEERTVALTSARDYKPSATVPKAHSGSPSYPNAWTPGSGTTDDEDEKKKDGLLPYKFGVPTGAGKVVQVERLLGRLLNSAERDLVLTSSLAARLTAEHIAEALRNQPIEDSFHLRSTEPKGRFPLRGKR